MKPTYRYLILIVYSILNLSIFWYAQYFLPCHEFLCALGSTLLIWTVLVLTTFATYRLKPLTFKKTLIRFFVTTIFVSLIYFVYYNSIDYSYWADNRWFFDYSLPGILFTFGFTLVWFLPDKINLK